MKILVADIGSNSIRTMTASVKEDRFCFSEKRVVTTRLADGLISTGRLAPVRIEDSLAELTIAAKTASALGTRVYAYATSAVRDAMNRDDFLRPAAERLGFPVRVLTGREEARFAYEGASVPGGGVFDIGGGSAQLVTATEAVSFPFGCVRALNLCPQQRFDTVRAALREPMARAYGPSLPCAPVWTGVGGTVTTICAIHLGLTRYDRAAVSSASLTKADVEAALRLVDAVPPERRAALPLLEKRHDVLMHGGCILLFLMQMLGVSAVFVSDADGMEGYARRILAGTEPA